MKFNENIHIPMLSIVSSIFKAFSKCLIIAIVVYLLQDSPVPKIYRHYNIWLDEKMLSSRKINAIKTRKTLLCSYNISQHLNKLIIHQNSSFSYLWVVEL